MTKYSTAIPATLILSLFSSVVHGQNYDERDGRLLKTSHDFQCFSDGLHVDPNDCAVFYRCTDWGESSENSIQSRFTAMKFRCAEGTVFDIERSNCVNIEETSRLECRQIADDDTFGRIFERQAGDSDYGVVQPQEGYNRPYQPPSYNRPGPEEPSEQNPGDSGDGGGNEPSSPSTSPPCEADGFFPIPNDCTHFYRCVSSGNGFIKYDFSCGPGTVWDPDNNACNHPWATSRPDCKSGTDGNQGGGPGPETIEISESPETAAQVAEPSSTTTSAPSTTRPTTRPSPSSTSSTRPSTTKPSTTTTKRSTAGSSSTTTTTEAPTSPATQGPKDNSTSGENSCSSEGFFPDGKNCTKFYRCVDEGNGKFTKYEFECAEGTIWDVQETTCNYPYAVQNDNCNSTSSESQTATTAGQSTSSSSETSSRPTSTTSSSYNRPTSQRPSSSRPSSSTSSSYNRPTSQSTSSTNQQSSSSQTTSSSNQSSSSSSQTTSSSSQTSSSSSQTTSSQSSSSTSSTSSQSTSSNQQTSSSQQSSSSTSSSSNQNNTTTNNAGSTTSSNSSQTSKDDKCTEEGFFPSSENCNKFYRCVSNEAGGFTKYNFNCGPGTVWDPENNVCNHPWAVKDEKCRSGGQGTTPMGESTTESSTTSSTQNGTTPSSSSSTTTQTSNQTTVTTTTESSSEPSTSVTTTESSSKPTETPDNSNATTTTDSTDETTTPSNNSTATTTEAGSKNNTKPGNGIKCEKAGYYPNPKDCKKFYRCVDWDGDKGERFSVYHFDCPAGTIFDPALNICNHEESVYPPRDCTGSGSQTTDSPSTSKPDNTTTTESPTTTDSSNTTDATTTEITSEPTTLQPTTLQPTTDASTNSTEPTTTGSSETTPQTTTPSESTTKKETETTTAGSTETTSPASTTTPEQTSTQPTTTEISTTPSSSETCPELGPDQYALVCPTGFRRHPKFCNLFYQCTVSKTMDTKIVILSCVNGTLYDEKKIQCLPPEETKKCDGTMMADSRNLKKADDSVLPIAVKSDKSMCPNEGSFSYKEDCRLFYKCKKDEQGKLTGFLYQCPEGFAFWSVSKRCEKTEKVPCENSKSSPTSWKSTLAPVESRNIGF